MKSAPARLPPKLRPRSRRRPPRWSASAPMRSAACACRPAGGDAGGARRRCGTAACERRTRPRARRGAGGGGAGRSRRDRAAACRCRAARALAAQQEAEKQAATAEAERQRADAERTRALAAQEETEKQVAAAEAERQRRSPPAARSAQEAGAAAEAERQRADEEHARALAAQQEAEKQAAAARRSVSSRSLPVRTRKSRPPPPRRSEAALPPGRRRRSRPPLPRWSQRADEEHARALAAQQEAEKQTDCESEGRRADEARLRALAMQRESTQAESVPRRRRIAPARSRSAPRWPSSPSAPIFSSESLRMSLSACAPSTLRCWSQARRKRPRSGREPAGLEQDAATNGGGVVIAPLTEPQWSIRGTTKDWEADAHD